MINRDEKIKKDIVDQLSWDNRVDISNICTEVNNGRVNLSGLVPSYFQYLAAENDIWLIPGVKKVENNLEIIYPKGIQVPKDAEIKSKVQDILSWTPDLLQSDIRVLVDNGWVTLEGSVDVLWKKIRAEKLATVIMGVLGITNKLAVVTSGDILDEAIAQTIVSALDRNGYIDIDSVNVKVENGKVILTGDVPNVEAYHKAYEAAFYTAGVTEIQNDMTIVQEIRGD